MEKYLLVVKSGKCIGIYSGLQRAKIKAIQTAYNNQIIVTVCDRDGNPIQKYDYSIKR